MMKKTKCTWSLTLMITFILALMPLSFAEGSYITVDKDFYLVSEPMTITVSGLNDSQINEQGAYLSVNIKDDSNEASSYNGMYTYVSSLRDGKTWTIDAPVDLNDYEVRLYVTEGDTLSMLQSEAFTVGSKPGNKGDIKINDDTFLVNADMTVTFSGLTKGQIADGAWGGIFLEGDAVETSTYNGMHTYVSSLRDGKTWKLKSPNEFGNYELRVFTKNADSDKLEAVKFAVIPFVVQSQPAKPNDLKLNKDAFLIGESATLSIKGLTTGQIQDSAWAGVYLPNDEFQTDTYNGIHTYISSLRDLKSWKFTVPSKPGEYQVRVFTKDVDAEDRELAYFGMESFTVLNATKVVKTNTPIDWSKYKLVVGSGDELAVALGNTYALNIKANPNKGGSAYEANTKVTYKSSNSKVVTVDKAGVLKGISKGKANVTVTAANKYKVVIQVTVE